MSAQTVQDALVSRRQSSRTMTRWLVASIAGLFLLNMATLLSDSVHSTLYKPLETVFSSTPMAMMTFGLSAAVLEHSPTTQRRGDVERATATLRESLRKAEAERDRYQSAHDKLEARYNDLDVFYRRLDSQHKQLSGTHQNLKAKAGRIAATVAWRTSQAVSRNVSSTAAEAIPLLGATVIVTMTMLDVMEACETMRDLEALSDLPDGLQAEVTRVCKTHVPTKDEVVQQVKDGWDKAYQKVTNYVPSNQQPPTGFNAMIQKLVSLVYR